MDEEHKNHRMLASNIHHRAHGIFILEFREVVSVEMHTNTMALLR